MSFPKVDAVREFLAVLVPLVFPDWVPAAVSYAAEEIRIEIASKENSTENLKLLKRLIADERMKPVWAELFKKKRVANHGAFLHPTQLFGGPMMMECAVRLQKQGFLKGQSVADYLEARAARFISELKLDLKGCKSAQDFAAQLFFRNSFYSAIDPKPTFHSDLKKRVRQFETIAKELRSSAQTLRSMEFEWEVLDAIADTCDTQASLILRRGMTRIIKRKSKRGDLKIRAFVLVMSITVELLFNMKLYGTIAKVCNVVLESRMTSQKVRAIVRA